MSTIIKEKGRPVNPWPDTPRALYSAHTHPRGRPVACLFPLPFDQDVHPFVHTNLIFPGSPLVFYHDADLTWGKGRYGLWMLNLGDAQQVIHCTVENLGHLNQRWHTRAAQLILPYWKRQDEIKLVCVLPCETQANGWTEAWRGPYLSILSQADEVQCLQAHDRAGCTQRRNQSMTDRPTKRIAVHDGSSPGGTSQTLAYARKRGLEVVVLSPYGVGS